MAQAWFSCSIAVGALLASACQFDSSGLRAPPVGSSDASVIARDAAPDAALADAGDAAHLADARPGDGAPPVCTSPEERCEGGIHARCDASGQWRTVETCDLGCSPSALRCARVRPSNGIDPAWLDQGTDPFSPTADTVVNTDSGTITPFSGAVGFHTVGSYACDPSTPFTREAGVFLFSSLQVPEGVTVRVVGSRAAVFLVSGPAQIHGVIDLSGGRGACPGTDQPWCAGPGGFEGGRGAHSDPSPGDGPGGGGPGFSHNPVVNDETSGGGGAHGGTGGHGGNENDSGGHSGGTGGTPYGTTTVEPLCGGSGGGGGGGGSGVGSYDSSHGGGGGGALQITSAESISIDCGALPQNGCGIQAGGGGGQADHVAAYDDGGGGGGAGGAILLEAPRVTIGPQATLAAGGGGGAGGYNGGPDCHDGHDAPLSGASAPGGAGSYPGGDGGAAGTPAGAPGSDGGDGTGGGGGGAGRIRLQALPSVSFSGTASPDGTTPLFTMGTLQID